VRKLRRKAIVTGLIIVLLLTLSVGLFYTFSSQRDEDLDREAEASFRYFWEQANHDPNSKGYGLVRDRFPGNPSIASIAATGFGLTAIPIGVERGWISQEEGYDRANRTLDTLLQMEHEHGFFYHFVNIDTGKREWKSEVSSIDTGLLMNGVLTVGEYFGGEVLEKSKQLYERVEWSWFVDPNKKQFYMAYYPEKGFQGHWDFYAEQLMLYILGAGSPTDPIGKDVYDGFIRHKASYEDSEPFIHSWFGSIFTYQYSHAWIDFRNLIDGDGVNWFENSVIASKASRQFAIDQKDRFKSLNENSWGITACDTPKGYNGLLGSPPSGYDNTAHQVEGTVAPAGAIGSIVFTPEESVQALKHYLTIPDLVGDYGLKDAFNLDANWVARDYIGIDKGITLLMISNYQDETVWEIFMKSPYVQAGLEALDFQRK
jgi:hypothetical protein